MDFLGVKVPGRSEWHESELNWVDHKPYILCPVDNPEEQMQCLKYEPCDALSWQCKYAECGTSDICIAKGG